jgi:hypothetical protein
MRFLLSIICFSACVSNASVGLGQGITLTISPDGNDAWEGAITRIKS